MRPGARWALTAACLALGGCGNAYEHLSVGEWYEAGKPNPPQDRFKGDFHVATLAPGEGPAVRAGNLVKISLRVTTVVQISPPRQEPDSQLAWVWVGQDLTQADSMLEQDVVLRFGYLGTARVRRALLGRQLHERFSIELDEDADGSVDAVPLDGILEADATRMNSLRRSLVSGKQMLAARTWPGVELSQRGPRSSADMEILNICEARLYRRTATLTQVGMVFAPGDAGYPLRRKGVLGWTAIEAKCPAPDGNIRLQAGPFYRRVGEEENSRLADWNSSYIRLRPPLEHPEEWRVVRDEPWKVVNERMAPIRKQIGDLQTAQERADTSCQFSKKCESPQQTEQRRQQLGRLVQEAIERQKALKCEIEKKCE